MVDLKANCHLMNGADLAYIGDAYYELMIRKYLLIHLLKHMTKHLHIIY